MDPRDLNRRQLLAGIAGAAGAALLAACGGGSSDTAAATTSTTAATREPPPGGGGMGADQGSEGEIPQETAGPYPGDGSNGPNVLTQDGVVRRDITTSFGDAASGRAEGVPLTIALTILDAATRKPKPGAAVYLWHCDREGRYSMYSEGVADQNYLRGVQVAEADGTLEFASTFPGAYSGRWPHIHFEVYESVADATGGGTPITTSQLALPEATCREVYATVGYEASATNLPRTTLARDGIFRDGVDEQLAAMTGSTARGWTATLAVAVA